MICEKCNNIIDEDSKFCSKCGERILVKVEESDINFIKKMKIILNIKRLVVF